MKRIYLVDLENVGKTFLKGKDRLKQGDEIYLFHNMRRGAYISDDILSPLKETPVKIHKITMDSTAKNGMDLQIGTSLGYLVGFHKQTAQYFILSKDRDYDCCIEFVRDNLTERVFIGKAADIEGTFDYEDRRESVKEALSGITNSKKQIRIVASALKKCSSLPDYHQYLQSNLGEMGKKIYQETKDKFFDLKKAGVQ